MQSKELFPLHLLANYTAVWSSETVLGDGETPAVQFTRIQAL